MCCGRTCRWGRAALARRIVSMGITDFRSILVTTKYRYIGDTLLAVPTLRAIRRHWPEAHITLLTGDSAAELLKGCPYVDEVIAFNPENPANRGINLYRNLVPRLRSARIDIAFIYHTSFHAAIAPWLAGARQRVGWAGFEGRDILFTKKLRYVEDRNELELDLDMVRAVAPEIVTDNRVELWLTPDDLADVPDDLKAEQTVIGIQPGATNNGKRWPAASFAALANEILARGLADKIAIIGGTDELGSTAEFLAEATAEVRGAVIDLTGKLRLRQTLAALKRLAFFVGNDTAIRHSTVALDVPSVGLFGPTNPVKWANCNPPRQQVLLSPTKLMKDIAPETVLAHVSGQLAGAGDYAEASKS